MRADGVRNVLVFVTSAFSSWSGCRQYREDVLRTVETLGAVTVICTDKTGTLTTGEMTVQRLWVAGREYELTGSGYDVQGRVVLDGEPVPPERDPLLDTALSIGALVNDALLERDEKGELAVAGDPYQSYLSVGNDVGNPGFVIPEPSSWVLAAAGVALALRRRRTG